MPCTNGSAACGMLFADPPVKLETVASLAALPQDAAFLADREDDVFGSRIWWETAARHAMPANATLSFVIARIAHRPVALFPMRISASPAAFDAFSTPYTCLFSPSLADGLTDSEKFAVFAAFGRICRRWGTVRLDAMPANWPDLALLIAGVRSARMAVLQFDHFGNWHAMVADMDWDRYLAGRPGALRETVRRRLRRAERQTDASFAVFASRDGIEAGIAAFESVYARSWKEPEPFPTFNAALMRAAAQAGWLRLGIWSIADRPVAAQFWIVNRGKATVLKLAHDEAFKAHSPGTVLTALMLRRLLNEEGIGEIDFGRGDDPYKEGWTGQRRQRIGLMLINPLRLSGARAFGRHTAGRILAALRRG